MIDLFEKDSFLFVKRAIPFAFVMCVQMFLLLLFTPQTFMFFHEELEVLSKTNIFNVIIGVLFCVKTKTGSSCSTCCGCATPAAPPNTPICFVDALPRQLHSMHQHFMKQNICKTTIDSGTNELPPSPRVGTSQESTDMLSRFSVKARETSVESRQITEFVRLRMARSRVERKDCSVTANGNHVQKAQINGFRAQVVSIRVSANSESPCCSAKARGLNFIHCLRKSTLLTMHQPKFQAEKLHSGSTPREK